VLRLNHVTVDAVSVAETVVSLSSVCVDGALSFRALTESLGVDRNHRALLGAPRVVQARLG